MNRDLKRFSVLKIQEHGPKNEKREKRSKPLSRLRPVNTKSFRLIQGEKYDDDDDIELNFDEKIDAETSSNIEETYSRILNPSENVEISSEK